MEEPFFMLFDTHAHYYDGRFDSDREPLLASLPGRGVELALCPGCDLSSSRACIALAERFPHVYAAVGIHPEDCGDWDDGFLWELRSLAAHAKVRAIGEIGLDYYWKENPPKALQQTVFRRQMELAQSLSLPVIVHDREAHGDALAMVKEFPGVTGVFHCYSGSVDMALELVELGWYLGFDGPITYENAKKAPEVVSAVPLERILVETDAPYMAPEPFRGLRNDSSYVYRMAETIAQVKGLTFEEVARQTTANGRQLFRIPDERNAIKSKE